MTEPLGNWTRTHSCGALRVEHIGAEVTLLGWVHRVRDLGSLVFIDLRDREGLTQIVVQEGQAFLEAAKHLRAEFVIGIQGTVRARGDVNPRMPTGGVEVATTALRVLNEAAVPPFQVADEASASEELRLRYRYLDLRRPRLQANLALRHRIAMAVRRALDAQGFLEVETPVLARSTPEGARDYLVPSRVHPGEFYALPQSPQLFKQLLMVAGTDRYFQIVKCFRDEDLRADRQPEFTQVDVEMSFARPDVVFGIVEPLMREVLAVVGRDVPTPFRRISYAEAMARYGSDKPDLRCGMEIADLSAAFAGTSFQLFADALASGGVVRGFVVPGGARYSRKQLDLLGEQAREAGAGALVWVRSGADGIKSPAVKGAGEERLRGALRAAGAGDADLLLMVAGGADAASKTLGQLRLAVAREEGLLKADEFAFTWVTDFPLLEWDAGEQRFFAMHHPFTSPVPDDVALLEGDPASVRAQAYDLVLNGSEIGGGSIRIHDPALQARVFRAIGLGEEEAKRRFGFFLEALRYGTPPHGGIALGLDRIVALLAGESSIREVIAFPKTAAAVDLMTGAPSWVDERQLRELNLRVVPEDH
ncbi:MAG TPA: aspartate--tRNA ligase [Vicinamibacterales bacterium]|nr:aspartate--tRNA ligase [Vicinamibacterales bacterium]